MPPQKVPKYLQKDELERRIQEVGTFLQRSFQYEVKLWKYRFKHSEFGEFPKRYFRIEEANTTIIPIFNHLPHQKLAMEALHKRLQEKYSSADGRFEHPAFLFYKDPSLLRPAENFKGFVESYDYVNGSLSWYKDKNSPLFKTSQPIKTPPSRNQFMQADTRYEENFVLNRRGNTLAVFEPKGDPEPYVLTHENPAIEGLNGRIIQLTFTPAIYDYSQSEKGRRKKGDTAIAKEVFVEVPEKRKDLTGYLGVQAGRLVLRAPTFNPKDLERGICRY